MAEVISGPSEHVSNAGSSEDTDGIRDDSDSNNTFSLSKTVPGLLQDAGFSHSFSQSYMKNGEQFTKVRTLNLSRISNKISLFRELEELLSFDHPRVRSECSDMIARIIPQLKNDLETCMSLVSPQLVRNLGHEDEEVRYSAANTLVAYARSTSDLENVTQHVIYNGLLENNRQFPQNRKGIISSIPLLFSKDLANKDWHLLSRGLASVATEEEAYSFEAVEALEALKQLVGEKRFQLYIFDMNENGKKLEALMNRSSVLEQIYEFSFVDPTLVNILLDKNERKLRVNAAEELKNVVKDVLHSDILLRELAEFLVFLSELLDDSDFKVNLVALDIYSILIEKLKWRLKKYLNRIVDDLIVHLGENKIVIRSHTSKVLRILISNLGPSCVISCICDNLTDPSQRHGGKMKEEVLNCIMVALLSYPSYEFDLRHICEAVAPNVLDPRRRVRLAALECLAVLAQSMGSSKLAIMASAIDSAAEQSHTNTEPALAAVLARLARRQLPRANDDGHLEYSLRIPSGRTKTALASSSYGSITTFPRGADVDWVMAGSGFRMSTPNSYALTDGNEGDAINLDEIKDHSASFPSSPAAPRRIISPGQGKTNIVSLRNNNYDSNGNVRSISNANLHSNRLDSPDEENQIHGFRENWLPSATLQNRTLTPTSCKLQSFVKNVQSLEDTRFVVDESRMHDVLPSPEAINHGRTFIGSYRLPSSDSTLRGRLLTGKSTAALNMDRGSSRPMDKVAAMLGSNILPNKVRPIEDKSKSEAMVDLKPITLPSIAHSNMWYGSNGESTLPTLPSVTSSSVIRNNNNNILRQPPIPMKPTMVRSSSGGRKARINSNKQQMNSEQIDTSYNNAITTLNWPQSFQSNSKSTISKASEFYYNGNGNFSEFSDLSMESLNKQQSRQMKLLSDSRKLYSRNNNDEEDESDNDRVGRPRSRSKTPNSLERSKRPRSLDLNVTLPPLEDFERQKLRRNLSSSSSGSPVWYENEKGVNNRALSEVSSLSSSIEENFPITTNESQRTSSSNDQTMSDKRTDLQKSQPPEPKFVNYQEIEDNSMKLVRRSSSLSWELPNSSRRLIESKDSLQRTNSLSLGSMQSQESKIEENLKPYDAKPIFVHDSNRKFPLSHSNSTTTTDTITLNHNNNQSNGFKANHLNQYIISSQSDKLINSEDINVIGKGMLPYNESSSPPQSPVHHPASPPVPALLHAMGENALPVVQGKNLAQLRNDSIGSLENEDPNSMSLSHSTFNKMMNKKMEMMQEAERRKINRQQIIEEKQNIAKELNGHVPKTPPDKPNVTRRLARQHLGASHVSRNGGLISSLSPADGSSRSKEPEDRLLRNPDEALRTAMSNMESDDWSLKCSGIRIISALSSRNPEIVADHLHTINLAILNEVKNLRSTVSRSAIQCVGELFVSMKKNMEGDLDNICKVLLHKSGESNVFIKEDVEKALTNMVENVTPQRAATALISGGANHRNAAVRKTTSQFLCAVCEKMGSGKIMSGTKDVTDKILLTASQFVMDGAPMTRYYGRKIFFMLLPHPEFDRTVRQYVPTNTVRNIQDILEGLRTKGIGSIPSESGTYKRSFK